jgi:hypothetical protein
MARKLSALPFLVQVESKVEIECRLPVMTGHWNPLHPAMELCRVITMIVNAVDVSA